MLLSLLLFESEFLHIVAISYTALVINELIMVALEITTWHTYMVLSELGTAVVYFGSMAILPAYFGEDNSTFCTHISDRRLHTCRPLIRVDDSIRGQGGHHRGSIQFPTLHDQGVSSPVQTGCLCQSRRYMMAA